MVQKSLLNTCVHVHACVYPTHFIVLLWTTKKSYVDWRAFDLGFLHGFQLYMFPPPLQKKVNGKFTIVHEIRRSKLDTLAFSTTLKQDLLSSE